MKKDRIHNPGQSINKNLAANVNTLNLLKYITPCILDKIRQEQVDLINSGCLAGTTAGTATSPDPPPAAPLSIIGSDAGPTPLRYLYCWKC